MDSKEVIVWRGVENSVWVFRLVYVCVLLCIKCIIYSRCMCTCEVCGHHVHVLYNIMHNYECVLCVVLLVVSCWLCINITKLTCPLTVSGDGVPHELPSVPVSM